MASIPTIAQKFSLATLFDAHSGHQWTRKKVWLNRSIHVCEWYDCLCAENETQMVLNLGFNDVVGDLPEEVSLRTSLRARRFVATPRLRGNISPRIRRILQLRRLEVCQTGLSRAVRGDADFSRPTSLDSRLSWSTPCYSRQRARVALTLL
jgi:hypothetical protein